MALFRMCLLSPRLLHGLESYTRCRIHGLVPFAVSLEKTEQYGDWLGQQHTKVILKKKILKVNSHWPDMLTVD